MCQINEYVTIPTEVVDPSIDMKRPFQLHYHSFDTYAKCLDGSMAGLYFSPGSGDGLKKTVVHF